MKKIKEFSDGSYVGYDRGSFDDWCVYLVNVDKTRKAPFDKDYFNQLKILSGTYGSKRLYDDYIKIYDATKKTVDKNVLNSITNIANTYGTDALSIDKIFTIIYLAMISEEQKAYTKLGKRIKRLAIHMILTENETVDYSANFMKKMGWQKIDKLCKERNF